VSLSVLKRSTKNSSTTQQSTQSTPSSSTELSSVTRVSQWRKLSRDHIDQSVLPGQTRSTQGRTDPQQMHGRDTEWAFACACGHDHSSPKIEGEGLKVKVRLQQSRSNFKLRTWCDTFTAQFDGKRNLEVRRRVRVWVWNVVSGISILYRGQFSSLINKSSC